MHNPEVLAEQIRIWEKLEEVKRLLASQAPSAKSLVTEIQRYVFPNGKPQQQDNTNTSI